ncbi:CLUMA_CG007295, isoform A [Clunio marinus]|uniref:CLUMA_CG007295, isoform A n=1 Tax=Clunio marinus TaxID=568069 RepID=A0A1J1I087_9DIPT|nr:CLUMA_CG007295, isoform A [Clunio marinus]
MIFEMKVFLIALCLIAGNCCEANEANYGVKGGTKQGMKSYGGYFHDPGHNHGANHFIQAQNYHQPARQLSNYYQPYGWNFNMPQRTYGGVIQPNTPSNQQGFGWFGGQNQQDRQYSNNPGQYQIPKLPSLFVPNFVPPVYFPNNNLPYPSFPNYNSFPFAPPFGNYPNTGGQQYPNNDNRGQFAPQQPSPNTNQVPNIPTSTTVKPTQGSEIRGGGSDETFATNAFFRPNKRPETLDRHWTEEDEQKWQATTKAPYFENKVPGLECTLPASAVLGATTALKASNLLPLNVPVGKPILSCNATDLLQAQINLDGIIYDCARSAITMSCPRLDANQLVYDECRGETLECDVRMSPTRKTVSCTNGTLISNHPIVCKTATLMEKKNILNCIYKNSFDSGYSTPSSVNHHSSHQPQTTIRPPVNTLVPPILVTEDFNNEGIDTRYSKNKSENLDLMEEVKHAMRSVFPSELLSIAQKTDYLPPQQSPSSSSMGKIPDELREEMNGVFPHELFAMSQTNDLNQDHHDLIDERLSVVGLQNRNNQATISENQRAQWNVNIKSNSRNSGTSFKTGTSQISQRFGGNERDDDDDDRLIFSP